MKNLDGIKELKPYIVKRFWKLLFIILLSFLAASISFLPLQIISTIIDFISNNEIYGYKRILVEFSKYNITILFILFTIFSIFESLISIICSYNIVKFTNDIIEEVRNNLVKWIFLEGALFKNSLKEGDIISRVTGDTNAIRQVVSGPLNSLLTEIIQLIIAIIIFISWSPILALVALSVTPFLFWITGWINKNSQETSKIERESYSELSNFLSNILNNMPIIKAFTTENHEQKLGGEYTKKISDNNLKITSIFNYYWISINILNLIGLVSTLVVSNYLMDLNKISPGDIFLIYMFLNKIYYPIRLLSKFSKDVFIANASLTRVFSLKCEESFSDFNRDCVEIKSPPELKLSNVSVKCNDNFILKDINLTIPPNCLFVILGNSGSGKSTLIRTLLGSESIDSGNIYINNIDVTNNLKYFRNIFRVSYQSSYLFDRSIKENVAYGNFDLSDEEAYKLLGKVGLKKIVDANSLKFRLGSLGKNISGGEQRRLSLARALNKDSYIYIFDEPTSELDSINRKIIIDLLNELKRNSTVIVTTHDKELSHNADILINLK